MQQLDIFTDSRDRQLLNALADAVQLDDAVAAEEAFSALAREFPHDRALGAAQSLIDTLMAESRLAGALLTDTRAAAAAAEALAHGTAAAACTVLGMAQAPGWLARRWRALARRASALPFSVDAPTVHAAACWLHGRAWVEAEAAVTSIESWRRKPVALAWMAQARWHTQGPDAAWPLLVELAWLAPQRLPALLEQLPEPRLRKLAHRYESAFDAEPDWSWWPAWLLVEQPLLAGPLDGAASDGVAAPQRGFKLMQALLRTERAGRQSELLALRRELKSLHPALFATYMATR